MGAVVLGIALFACGGIVRDGFPSFKEMLAGLVGTKWEWVYHLSTQWARISGAVLCGLGTLLFANAAYAALVFVGILAGFYLDMKHGEAAGVDTPVAVGDAFLSGITSVLPLALVLSSHVTVSHWIASVTTDLRVFLPIVLIGIPKPAIWKLCWLTRMDAKVPFLEPTRVAAAVFYAAIGAGVYGVVG